MPVCFLRHERDHHVRGPFAPVPHLAVPLEDWPDEHALVDAAGKRLEHVTLGRCGCYFVQEKDFHLSLRRTKRKLLHFATRMSKEECHGHVWNPLYKACELYKVTGSNLYD